MTPKNYPYTRGRCKLNINPHFCAQMGFCVISVLSSDNRFVSTKHMPDQKKEKHHAN
jgi:hypothetical protein